MKSGSIHHDGDRITHCDATPLVLATGRSPASAVFVRSRSTNLSRSTAPPRTHSRNRRRTLPWIVPRLATTFERRSNYSASSVRGPRIPIDRAYDIDALPTRGFLLWRLSNAGHFPAWRRSTVVGRHPKPFTKPANVGACRRWQDDVVGIERVAGVALTSRLRQQQYREPATTRRTHDKHGRDRR